MLAVAQSLAYRILSADWKREDGQTMAEYGIILAVVAVVAVAAFIALQGGITNTLNSVTANL
ncbi:MAG TPA: Flp family type IVb pilin [Gaiellaceae bacterium]|nr:Flp family type IVb pilin [Gaiellaceae bacterium]